MTREDFRRELGDAMDSISGSPDPALSDRVRAALVEAPERRAAIAGDKPRRVAARPPIALLLHQAEANEGLIAGDEHPALAEVVFVVEADVSHGDYMASFWSPWNAGAAGRRDGPWCNAPLPTGGGIV